MQILTVYCFTTDAFPEQVLRSSHEVFPLKKDPQKNTGAHLEWLLRDSTTTSHTFCSQVLHTCKSQAWFEHAAQDSTVDTNTALEAQNCGCSYCPPPLCCNTHVLDYHHIALQIRRCTCPTCRDKDLCVCVRACTRYMHVMCTSFKGKQYVKLS